MEKKGGFAAALLRWYDREARRFPWRTPPGHGQADPYRVLVSEVMLQQTTTAVVETRYPEFMARFPDLAALAEAPEAEVLAAWAGLGYYRRARALHACARALVSRHGGVFPKDEASLRQLPGIGPYTGAAIAAIAFDEPVVVVDGNIERIVARLFAIDAPLPRGKTAIRNAAATLTPDARPGDFAQAMMDLGARVCRPRAPVCSSCPVMSFCDALATGRIEDYPVKQRKPQKRRVKGDILVLTNDAGAIFCEERPADGLFAGMLGLPGGGWDGRLRPPIPRHLSFCGGISHVLTHRVLDIDVYRGSADCAAGPGRWVQPDEAARAMPTLFRKALERGLNPGDP